jgi:uncharacterized protein YyaL (SSP411 family)
MPNRLVDAVSPYLRAHAENPVDWHPWGEEPFAEAARRDVPVLVSIGYATCHWCHVMARESFSDPAIAAILDEGFVAIKVDREEHPEVDATYLAAASAFTSELGWPLTVFATPEGRPFFAGTYFPPQAIGSRPSFRMVLAAVSEAWRDRRDEVENNAGAIANALAAAGARSRGRLPDRTELDRLAEQLARFEDAEFGGFGSAPKFPVGTVLHWLLDLGSPLAGRTLDAMAASPLRDPIEGGFFRYATRRDWGDPHYERMLYDNALLLGAYARAGRTDIARGIAEFLLTVLRVPSGAFASGQDSESTVDGERVEGGYYALSAERRAQQSPPALDEKVLTGWNGLAIEALALAGRLLGEPGWIAAASEAAEVLLSGPFVRARVGERLSTAVATLEDYGMFASGLVELALATGEPRYAAEARRLVDESLAGLRSDDTLTRQGLATATDPSEGAYPSGTSALASAAYRLYLLGAGGEYREAAVAAMEEVADLARQRPIAFGSALGVMTALASDPGQLVVVTDQTDDALASVARTWQRPGAVSIAVLPAAAAKLEELGFELFEGRGLRNDAPAAYLCRDFVCALPVGDASVLTAQLADSAEI